MSLLTACQQVAQETGLLSSPSGVVASTDPGVVQLFALMKRAAVEISDARNWQRLIREHTITTANGTETYALPSDWSRYISKTAWDATNYWEMRGSLSPQMWQAYKRGIVTLVSAHKNYRVRGNLVYIMPTPTAIESLVIEYIRDTPWTDSTGATFRTAPTADTDLFVLPQSILELDTIWRLKRAKGLEYSADYDEAQRAIDLAYAQDVPAQVVNMGRMTNQTPPFYPNLPQSIT